MRRSPPRSRAAMIDRKLEEGARKEVSSRMYYCLMSTRLSVCSLNRF